MKINIGKENKIIVWCLGVVLPSGDACGGLAGDSYYIFWEDYEVWSVETGKSTIYTIQLPKFSLWWIKLFINLLTLQFIVHKSSCSLWWMMASSCFSIVTPDHNGGSFKKCMSGGLPLKRGLWNLMLIGQLEVNKAQHALVELFAIMTILFCFPFPSPSLWKTLMKLRFWWSWGRQECTQVLFKSHWLLKAIHLMRYLGQQGWQWGPVEFSLLSQWNWNLILFYLDCVLECASIG